MKRLRILLDCDGVIADYCTPCFNLIEELSGDRHTHEEVTHWDIFTVLGKGHLKSVMKERASAPGWCIDFPMYDGSQDAVRRLEELGEVVIVTSPMSTPHWADERRIWLENLFRIPKRRVISAEGKEYVGGDFLIDDADENCVRWHEAHPNATTILWDAPYNRHFDVAGTGIVRARSWTEVFTLIEQKRDS